MIKILSHLSEVQAEVVEARLRAAMPRVDFAGDDDEQNQAQPQMQRSQTVKADVMWGRSLMPKPKSKDVTNEITPQCGKIIQQT